MISLPWKVDAACRNSLADRVTVEHLADRRMELWLEDCASERLLGLVG